MTHFLYVPFTGLGLYGGYRGDKWLENRIRIFKEYTIAALMNQTNKNFVLWVSWRPEEKTNPQVMALEKSLSGLEGLTIVFTYGGLCFYDDKYGDEMAKKRLLHSLSLSLPALKRHIEGQNSVLLTIQPSDDMYLSNSVDCIQKFSFNKVAGWTKGYVMSYNTKEIAEYNPNTIPPFFTFKFPTNTFLDPQKHMDYTGPYKSHEHVKNMDFVELPNRGFVVGTHGENISTTFNHPYKGRTLTKDEQDKILLMTGTYNARPLEVKNARRLIIRKVFNLIPFNNKIRNIYHNVQKFK